MCTLKLPRQGSREHGRAKRGRAFGNRFGKINSTDNFSKVKTLTTFPILRTSRDFLGKVLPIFKKGATIVTVSLKCDFSRILVIRRQNFEDGHFWFRGTTHSRNALRSFFLPFFAFSFLFLLFLFLFFFFFFCRERIHVYAV